MKREFKFTMGSFLSLAEKYGSVNKALSLFNGEGMKSMTAEALNLVIDLAYAGLKSSNKKLTRDDVADSLTLEELPEVMNGIAKALSLALPEATGNPPAA